MNELRLTILGCGTSTGVPVILCPCEVCTSKDPRNQRLRASAWLEVRQKSILIDVSTDFRLQALQTRIPKVDAILVTHPHADHVGGLDDLRVYNYFQKDSIPLYGNNWTIADIKNRFPYFFQSTPAEGGGVPQIQLHQISGEAPTVEIAGIPFTPLSLRHGSKECLGYRIDSIAYVTDCSYIPPESLERMKGLSVLILDCLRLKPHTTHLNLEQALEIVQKVNPKQTYLTHLGHDFDYETWKEKLPSGVSLAHDGLQISLPYKE